MSDGNESGDAAPFSRLVETYCSEFGRGRLRRYLVPLDAPSTSYADRIYRVEAIDDRNAPQDKLSNVTNARADVLKISPEIIKPPSDVASDKDKLCGDAEPEFDDDENENQDQLFNKTSSPPSSVTSRKLEWDSLADVGYANADQNKSVQFNNLSTIERMALEKHHKSDLTIDYKDDDLFKSSLSIKYITSLGAPDAQSTPSSPPMQKVLKKSISKTSKKPSTTRSSEKIKNIRKHSSKHKKHHRLNFKNVSIHVDVNKSYDVEFPKTQNIHIENQNAQTMTDSSSAQNDVQEHSYNPSPIEKICKSIQTTISSQNSDDISGKFKKSSSSSSEINSIEEDIKNKFNLESFENTDISIPVTTGNTEDNIECSGLLSKADSFEFMPGHLFNAAKSPSPVGSLLSKESKDDENLQSDANFHLSSMERNSIPVNTSDSHTAGKYDSIPKSSTYSTNNQLANFETINRLVQLRHTDPVIRRNLTEKIMKLLTQSNTSNESKSSTISVKKASPCDKENIFVQQNLKNNKCQTEEQITRSKTNIATNTVDCSNNSQRNKFSIDKKLFSEQKNLYSQVNDKYCQTSINNSKSSSPTNKASSNKSNNEKDLPLKSLDLNFQDNEKYSQTSPKSSNSYESKNADCSDQINAKKLLEKEHIIKKMSSHLQSKETINSKINETQRQLNTINNEILKLFLLKLKLENKHTNNNSENILKFLSTLKSPNINLTPNSPDNQVLSLAFFDSHSKSSSSRSRSINNIDIPPLNLKSSSDELCDSARTNSKHQSSSNKENQKTVFSSERKQNVHASKSLSVCNCSSKSSTTVNSCCEFSKSNSYNNSYNSKESLNTKLQNLKKNYSKYKKCKIMKSFLKDYDELILKYKNMKISANENKNSPITSVIPSNKCSNNASSISDAGTEKKSSERLEKRSLNSGLSAPIISNRENPPSGSKDDELRSISIQHKSSSISSKNVSNRPHSDIKENESKKSDSSSVFDLPMIKEMLSLMERLENHLQLTRNNSLSKINVDTRAPSSSKKSKTSTTTNRSVDEQNLSDNNVELPGSGMQRSSKPRSENSKSIQTPIDQNLDVNDCMRKKICPFCETNFLKRSESKCLKCYKNDLAKLNKLDKKYPKPLAYNLVLEPSDSFIDEPTQTKNRRVLDEIVVKIPKMRHRNSEWALQNIKNRATAITQIYLDSMGSTDDQLKEFSSLNDDNLSRQTSIVMEDILPMSHDDIEIPNQCQRNNLTIEDYLKINRPVFIDRANQRQHNIKKFNETRKVYEIQRRKLLEKDLSNILDSKKTSVLDIRIPKPSIMPTLSNNRVFNSKEMVKRTAREYKKLPEVKKRKDMLKKQRQSKTNRLMTEMFVKKLQQKTLKGIVNISHSSNIISL